MSWVSIFVVPESEFPVRANGPSKRVVLVLWLRLVQAAVDMYEGDCDRIFGKTNLTPPFQPSDTEPSRGLANTDNSDEVGEDGGVETRSAEDQRAELTCGGLHMAG